MLLIGDIHINYKEKDYILTALREGINQHSEEKNIIFLGDFVYSFWYDRTSLLELYDFFLELYNQKKNLYILAGNHDRLKDTFVFEEGKKTWEIFNQNHENSEQSINFITEPLLKTIEGEKILFLPHVIKFNLNNFPGIEDLQTETYKETIQKNNKNLTLSADLNLILEYFKKKEESFTVMHHYYFEKTEFPWQKATFSEKDGAIQKHRLNDPNIKFISGHLHKSFFFQNYLCIGSVRATSPTETNQLKGIWTKKNDQYTFHEMDIKTYLEINKKGDATPISTEDIDKMFTTLQKEFQENTTWLKGDYDFIQQHHLKNISISILADSLEYSEENVQKLISNELEKEIHDFKIKKKFEKSEITIEWIENSEELITSMKEWKVLLKQLLQQRYPDQYQEYEDLLHELKIL